MSLFDMIKDKAAELLGGASEKVGEVADGVAQSAADVTESGRQIVDSASAQGIDALGATGAVDDAIDPNARG
ncbi:hypothetical protein [Amycolatopsis nalaikhensis]|uniref:Antitoxin protein of toxin-antitoxin system n=1 Tax=Amycolatopsis nalaikhensis TaxID=715472 RepID=A0ABY8XJZ1_9PSEU|nr:hypothetical protein [Amycolatopsis sp. 2-2]WIV55941.1 hypothetical protein QP939_45275 [Amycolatopsis sp. 2-2]